jgi:hypothetical protein
MPGVQMRPIAGGSQAWSPLSNALNFTLVFRLEGQRAEDPVCEIAALLAARNPHVSCELDSVQKCPIHNK